MWTSRWSLGDLAPDAYRACLGVETYIRSCGLEQPLAGLVKVRASQINGCAFCIDMHTREARNAGETEQRLYLLDGWRDADIYTPRERAALAWTEHLTKLPAAAAPEDDVFSDIEVANLLVLIGMINLWNRVMIGGRAQLAAA